MHERVCTCMWGCVFVFMCLCKCVCACACAFLYVRVFVCVCVCNMYAAAHIGNREEEKPRTQ